ncbi:snurportin-1 [Ischnura elegans]|uniref:snurportin-1 n=1 Tax=Ischnura elegans TaxID=197161 RepID=UPI001ED88DF4|nr:snurportin-1 [Ischnura elegans]
MDSCGRVCDRSEESGERSSHSCYREMYKKRNVLSQEERRRRTLESQKKRRNDIFDLNRSLDFNEETESMVENMETESAPCERGKRVGIRKILMHSEWMTETPEDLQDSWCFVPSPVGKRCVLIAQKGITKIFSKWGSFLRKFQSSLPSGFKGEYRYGPTILDCIWSESKSICYILDVIFWKGQSFNECEAEFRFFWLKNKFEEMPLMPETAQKEIQLQVLPSSPYSPSDLASEIGILSPWASQTSTLDGILFYHKNGHYHSGKTTPLVTWLKPFMLPEALGVEIPDVYLQEQPENYESMEKYIAENILKSKERRKKRISMEVDDEAALAGEEMKVDASDPEEIEPMARGNSPTECEGAVGGEGA